MDDLSSDKQKEALELILTKAGEAKAELEEKIEEMVIKAYEKLRIAHLNQIKELQEEIATLKADVYTLQHKKTLAE